MRSFDCPVHEGEILAGKFRVEAVLGVGGMGVVVAATHVQLQQRVALKFLLPQSLDNPALVSRFEREARAAVRLKSEHVARVIDVGTLESGAPYMVMEYLEGCDLATVLERDGPLPVTDAVDYLLQACEAVAEAHSIGIIHRDLKPRNLFLTRHVDGRPLVKVLDFGISKLTSASEEHSLTRTTEIIGSPNYMSPEQLRAARLVDARSDIWSLGTILYELLSGKVPFEAETLAQLCAMVIQDPPRPLHELRPGLPPGLSAIIERCLEKDPQRRFQHVGELAAALDRFAAVPVARIAQRVQAVALGSQRSVAPSIAPRHLPGASTGASGTSAPLSHSAVAPSRKRRTGLWAAAAGIVFTILLGGLMHVWRSHADGTLLRPSAPAPASQSITEALPAPTDPSAATAGPSTVASASTPEAQHAPPASPGTGATAATSVTLLPAARTASKRPPSPPPKPPLNPAVHDDLPDERH